MSVTVVKPNLGPHAEAAHNRLGFDDAYNLVRDNPGRRYLTRGAVTFTTTASVATKGAHRGERVLVFKSEGNERARAYACCWGHRTNCNSTHIDIYSEGVSG